jgi:hypothetical protein
MKQKQPELKVRKTTSKVLKLSKATGKAIPKSKITPKHVHRAPKIGRPEYVQLLMEADKYPLSMRIAAELSRGGVDISYFETTLFKVDDGINRHIHDAMLQITKGKVDVEKVPPFRPVYVQFVDPKMAKENAFRGRPSDAEAQAELRRFIDAKVKSGWAMLDVIRGLREIAEPPSDKIKVKIKDDIMEGLKKEASASVTRALKEAKQKIEALNIQLKAAQSEVRVFKQRESVAATLKSIRGTPKPKETEPTEEPVTKKTSQATCSWCNFRLNGLIVLHKDDRDLEHQPMHLGCYYMNSVSPAGLVDGFEVLSPAEGVFYRYDAKHQKWEKVVADEKVVTSGESSPRVPAPSGTANIPPAVLPAKAEGKK